MRLRTSSQRYMIVKKITTIYMRLFTLCSYLKTKESYDRWVTRRLWGFRQQIFKAKYLRMSIENIRKLQENTVALYTERKTLRVSVIKGSEHVWPEKLKRPPLPSGCEISGEGGMLAGQNSSPGGMSYAAQGGPSACARCRDPSLWWHGARKTIRINSIRIPQEDMWRAPLSGLPHDTREHHTQTIAYPIRVCCSDHWLKVSKPCFVIRTACHRPCSAAIRWCVRTPCPNALSGHLLLLAFRICLWQRTSKIRFFMFLSFPLLCHGFQITLLNHGLLWW